jgi:hypothetical protein
MIAWLTAKLEKYIAHRLVSYVILKAKEFIRLVSRNLEQKKDLEQYKESVKINEEHNKKMDKAEELLNSGNPKP